MKKALPQEATKEALYDSDFYEWIQQVAERLREGRLTPADLWSAAAEIADMGKRDRREARPLMTVLVMHLMKSANQPKLRNSSTWHSTINEQRDQINAILANVSKHISLTDEEQKFWRGLLRSKHVTKHECLLQVGDVSRYQHFVVSGCLRTYLVAEDGKEHILQFAPEDWWTGNMSSMLKNAPSQLIIDALEDTVVLQIDKPGQDQLYERVPKFERFFRILITNAFMAQHGNQQHQLPPEDRRFGSPSRDIEYISLQPLQLKRRECCREHSKQ